MTLHHLDSLFRPAAVAVVDGGDARLFRLVSRNLLDAGLAGPVLPVTRSGSAVHGVLAYDSIPALPLTPALCVLAAPAAALPDLLTQCAAKGTRAAVAISAEPGDTVALHRHAKALGLRLLGPRDAGVQIPAHGLNASLAPAAPPGQLALVSQSASVASIVVDWAAGHGVGFSAVVTPGAEADVTVADCLDWLALDTGTRAILLYLDTIAGARTFLSAARAAARTKPVIAFRPGGGGDDHVWDAAFRRAGILRVRDLEAVFDAAETLALARPASGDRLFVVANGVGIGTIAAGALAAAGGRLARPAFQLGADAGAARYAEAVAPLLTNEAGDAVLVLHGPTALASGLDAAEAVAAVVAKTRRCVLTCWLGDAAARSARDLFTDRRVPTYDTPGQAVRAFLQLVEHRRSQEALTQTPPSVPEDFAPDAAAARVVIAAALAEDRQCLTDAEARAVLDAYGVGACSVAVSLAEHPVFGPVLTVGTVAALPPLNMHLAAQALDHEALTLVKLAQLAVDLPEVAELTLDAQGCRMLVRAWQGDAAARLAVRPYPKQLETPLALPDGRNLLVRPVLPEDEPALQDLFARMTSDAVRLRFFAPMRALSHAAAARLTQLDFDREMAFVVAEPGHPGAARLFGMVHVNGDADRERGEFAIMLASDAEGLGLGPLLMRRMLDHARAAGMHAVFGEVLRENRTMLKLCQAFGFRQSASPDDPEVMHVEVALSG